MNSHNVGWRDAGVRGLIGSILLLNAAALQDRPLVALGFGFIGIILIGTGLFRMCRFMLCYGSIAAEPFVKSAPLVPNRARAGPSDEANLNRL